MEKGQIFFTYMQVVRLGDALQLLESRFHRHRITLFILFLVMTTWGQDILLP